MLTDRRTRAAGSRGSVRPGDRPGAVPAFVLAWLVAVAVWVTWSPFELDLGERPGSRLFGEWDLEFFGHFLLLAPLAAVLAARNLKKGGRRPVLYAWLWTASVGVALEAGQFWIRFRDVSSGDWLAGAAGAAGAVWLTRRALARGIPARQIVLASAGAVLLAACGSLAWAMTRAGQDLLLAGWDPAHAVVAGNEVTLDRRFPGEVRDAEICAGADARRVCLGPAAGPDARRQLVREAERSQQISFSASVLSQDEHAGPSRIVTFSMGPERRNASLGMDGDALVLRVRTTRSGPNGTDIEFVLPGAVPRGSPTLVRADFRKRTVWMAASGSQGTVSGRFRPDLFANTLATRGAHEVPFDLVRGGRGALFGMSVVFIGMGFVLAHLPRQPGIVVAGLAPVLGAAALWGFDLGVLDTLPPDPVPTATAAGGALAGTVSGLWARRGAQ